MTVSSRLAAGTLRVLPRKRMSRAIGAIAAARAPKPVVDAAIRSFVRAYGVDLEEAEIPDAGFQTFDEFFTRRLKRGARVVDAAPNTLVSPADGALEDFGPIDDEAELLVKGKKYSAAELLGDETAAARYQGGRYWIVYLSPRDYHRVHAPVKGDVRSVRYVPGTLFPVNRIGTEHVPRLFARNERISIVQQSRDLGEVTTIMVGAIGVGRIGLSFDSVETNQGHEPGERHFGVGQVALRRGDELGVFHLGSTAIVMVGPESGMEPCVPAGDKVRMGMALARGGHREQRAG